MTESVWDYPRPPRIDRETRLIRVRHGGIIVAETKEALAVKETSGAPVFYCRSRCCRERLSPSQKQTLCEWKGTARYFDLNGSKDAAWCYPNPRPAFAAIAGWYAFFAGRVDECWLGDERVEPQPGDYYGAGLPAT